MYKSMCFFKSFVKCDTDSIDDDHNSGRFQYRHFRLSDDNFHIVRDGVYPTELHEDVEKDDQNQRTSVLLLRDVFEFVAEVHRSGGSHKILDHFQFHVHVRFPMIPLNSFPRLDRIIVTHVVMRRLRQQREDHHEADGQNQTYKPETHHGHLTAHYAPDQRPERKSIYYRAYQGAANFRCRHLAHVHGEATVEHAEAHTWQKIVGMTGALGSRTRKIYLRKV